MENNLIGLPTAIHSTAFTIPGMDGNNECEPYCLAPVPEQNQESQLKKQYTAVQQFKKKPYRALAQSSRMGSRTYAVISRIVS